MNITFNLFMSKQVTLSPIEPFTAVLTASPKPNKRKIKVTTNITEFINRKRGQKKKLADKILMSAWKARGWIDINPIDISDANNNEFINSDTWYSSSDFSFEDESSITEPPNSPTKSPPSSTKRRDQKKQNLGTHWTYQIDWSSKKFFPVLVKTIQDKRTLGNLFLMAPISMTTDGVFVPRTTLQSVMKWLKDKPLTHDNCFPIKMFLLLSNDSLLVLQDIIQKRNQINNGVSQKEAIQIISDLGHTKSNKVAENHLDYLIRNGKVTSINQLLNLLRCSNMSS